MKNLRCLVRIRRVGSGRRSGRPLLLSHSMSTTAARRVRIYTRTGDQGSSSLFTGERRTKSDPVFDCLGTADECNAHIGLSIEFLYGHLVPATRDALVPMLTEVRDVAAASCHSF